MALPHLLKLHVLASGSKGNCSIVEGPQGCIMIDDGIPRSAVLDRLSQVHVQPTDIKAIVLTHEHNDHVQGLKVWTNKFDIPLFAPAGIPTERKALSQLEINTFEVGSELSLCGMSIQTFSTSHDVVNPCGYRFNYHDDAIAYVTDTGFLTPHACKVLQGARILALETNHDVCMLQENQDYPRVLKERIAGNFGHLSNKDAATYAKTLVTKDTEELIGMHLSQHNNRPSLAIKELCVALDATLNPVDSACNFTGSKDGLHICVASQTRPISLG